MAIQRVSFSDPDAVWLHKKTAEPCRLVATFSDDVEARLDVNGRNRYSLDLLRNGESIKKGFVEPEAQAVVEELFSLRVVYVPPIGSLSPAENFSNWHNVKMGIDQGAISQYWRRYLYWLYNDGGKDAFDRVLNMVTEYLPGVKVLPPRLTHSDPPAVEIQFEEEGTSLDISGSGGGLRTILNLASILTFSRSKCLLLDEPEAHLHATLQRDMARLLFDYATDSGTQVIVATHARATARHSRASRPSRSSVRWRMPSAPSAGCRRCW